MTISIVDDLTHENVIDTTLSQTGLFMRTISLIPSPWNEASKVSLSFSVLRATESWVGPGNKASVLHCSVNLNSSAFRRNDEEKYSGLSVQ